MKRLGCYILLFCMVASLLAPPAQASQVQNSDCIASSESVETDYAEISATVEQAPNRSDVVRITYNRLSSVDRLSVELPSDVTIIRATGFTNETDTATVEYTGGDQAVLEYRIGTEPDATQYANGSNWIFAPAPTHIGTGVNLELGPTGVVGNEFLYIGNHTEYTTSTGCHEISLVTSTAGELTDNPEQIIDALEYTAENLEIGHRYEDVTIFATPGFANPPHLGLARSSDAWVTQSSLSFQEASHTRMILHEYIHTRQAYNQAAVSDMTWITEGSADYFSYRYSLETNAITPERYNAWLTNGSQMNGSLSDRTTWESEFVEYPRGGAYLAVLDQKIQSVSNNSVETVFHRINTRGNPRINVLIQRHQFLDTVENVSSPSVREWANSTMDSPSAYNISAAKVDEDSETFIDGLADRFERQTTEQPYLSVLTAIFLGLTLGLLLHDVVVNRETEEAEEQDEGQEE